MDAGLIALIVVAVFLFIVAASGVRIVPQARAGIVERLGRYNRTLDAGLAIIVPFVDRLRPLIDLRDRLRAKGALLVRRTAVPPSPRRYL